MYVGNAIKGLEKLIDGTLIDEPRLLWLHSNGLAETFDKRHQRIYAIVLEEYETLKESTAILRKKIIDISCRLGDNADLEGIHIENILADFNVRDESHKESFREDFILHMTALEFRGSMKIKDDYPTVSEVLNFMAASGYDGYSSEEEKIAGNLPLILEESISKKYDSLIASVKGRMDRKEKGYLSRHFIKEGHRSSVKQLLMHQEEFKNHIYRLSYKLKQYANTYSSLNEAARKVGDAIVEIERKFYSEDSMGCGAFRARISDKGKQFLAFMDMMPKETSLVPYHVFELLVKADNPFRIDYFPSIPDHNVL